MKDLAAAMAKAQAEIKTALKDSKNPVHDCAVGAVNLACLLYKESRGTMPLQKRHKCRCQPVRSDS